MTTINVTTPTGGRAVFTRRGTGTPGHHATNIPGTIELPALADDDYYQVTLRTGEGTAWTETYAIRPEAGIYNLEDLDRLPLGEAAAGGFALAAQVAALDSQLDVLDDFVEHHVTARIGAVEWDVDQLDDRLTSQHGETVNAIGILESQIEVLDGVVEAHHLGTITWIESARAQIPGYVPQPVARSYRLEMDIVTENHTSSGTPWLRVMDGDTQLMHLTFGGQSGDNHRYRFQVDFNAPANADLTLAFDSALINPSSGRAGYTRPQLTSPTVRSA